MFSGSQVIEVDRDRTTMKTALFFESGVGGYATEPFVTRNLDGSQRCAVRASTKAESG
jgi:hypothetical protein